MIIFNQQKQSGNLGNTNYSIARWGCLDTVVTMIYNYINGKLKTPKEISDILSFTQDGNLIWGSLDNIGLKLKSRVRAYSKFDIDRAYQSKDEYIALQVNNNHWVWVIGRYIPYYGYRIADPLHGDKAYTRRYENNITGYALIVAVEEEKKCNRRCPKCCK